MSSRTSIGFGALLAALAGLRLLFPSDAPFINDEPTLIHFARLCTDEGTCLMHGLASSRSTFLYGPFAIWFYAGLLTFVRDLPLLVLLRAALVSLVTLGSLLWIRHRIPAIPRTTLLFPFLSPLFYLYSRQLWDNTFLIPCSALTVAAFLAFTQEQRRRDFTIIVIGCTLMVLTHLMSLMLIVPLIAQLLFFHWRWFKRNASCATCVTLLAVVLLAPYCWELLQPASPDLVAARTQVPPLEEPVLLGALTHVLLSGRIFSAHPVIEFGFDLPSIILRSSLLSVPLVLFGAVAALRIVRRKRRADPLFQFALLALTSMLTFVCVAVLAEAFGHYHYYNATWILTFALLVIGLMAITNMRLRFVILMIQSFALAFALVWLVVSVHMQGGNTSLMYGATLKQQIAIVREVASSPSGTEFQTTVEQFMRFPHALGVIQELITVEPSSASAPKQYLLQPDVRRGGGWIVLINTSFAR